MRGLKFWLIIMSSAILITGLGGAAFAFHSGGVAECGGCHSMHDPKAGGSFLLVGTDQSSTCLTCHSHSGDTGPSSYHILTADADQPTGIPPKQRTPGGDFGWLKKTFSYVLRNNTTTELGERHGHNIVAVDNGLVADAANTTAPGGAFPASQLACNSCHDPHGKYRRLSDGTVATAGAPTIGSGSYDNSAAPAAGQAVGVYRLLAGAGYTKGGVTFNGVPAAVVPSTYNRTEATTQTRVAYGKATTGGHESWGQWCATCHGSMHSSGNYVHPTDETLGSTIAALYDQYRGSGNMTGTHDTAFLSLVPFVENTADYSVLASHAKNNDSFLAGPSSTDNVSCVSCHRAHATGFAEMLRWNMEGEILITGGSWGGTDAVVVAARDAKYSQGRTYAEMKAAYYDRAETQFASTQRVFCNKCHAKD